ncbi:hypothetical protein EA473_20735 [Natrarchaeobius chitinivorans]|uniref:Uncharacterized protein n=1 Tax=Natrarchaeobius chitinivorans TaxID=1679083 RepID=A0A3N6NZV9_NATCH|nr:hypothetical protein EA473_20735 [Natrarchaeobius chitinivorans]
MNSLLCERRSPIWFDPLNGVANEVLGTRCTDARVHLARAFRPLDDTRRLLVAEGSPSPVVRSAVAVYS